MAAVLFPQNNFNISLLFRSEAIVRVCHPKPQDFCKLTLLSFYLDTSYKSPRSYVSRRRRLPCAHQIDRNTLCCAKMGHHRAYPRCRRFRIDYGKVKYSTFLCAMLLILCTRPFFYSRQTLRLAKAASNPKSTTNQGSMLTRGFSSRVLRTPPSRQRLRTSTRVFSQRLRS